MEIPHDRHIVDGSATMTLNLGENSFGETDPCGFKLVELRNILNKALGANCIKI